MVGREKIVVCGTKLDTSKLLFATFLQSLLDDSSPYLLKLSAGDENSPEIRSNFYALIFVIMKLQKIALTILVLATPWVGAQDATQVKVEVKGVKVEQQQTPQVQALNIVDKKWKPKNWLEIEVAFDIKLARDAGGRSGSLAAMDVKYFIGLNQKSEDGKNVVLSGTMSYKDVPADTACFGLAFVSPSTLKRILQKDNAGKGDVVAHGVEVLVGGKRVASGSSTGSPWWFDANTQGLSDKFAFEDGAVLPKSKTPFAPFWGDYDLPVSAQ
jgi:hypothetical protein